MVRPVSAEAIAIVGVGVALLAVLVPLLLTIGRRIDTLAADVAELRRDLHALAERCRPHRGAGSWRPASKTPPGGGRRRVTSRVGQQPAATTKITLFGSFLVHPGDSCRGV